MSLMSRANAISILAAASPCAVSATRTRPLPDRKSTRLNSSHANISYAVFYLKKKHRRRAVLFRQGGDRVQTPPHDARGVAAHGGWWVGRGEGRGPRPGPIRSFFFFFNRPRPPEPPPPSPPPASRS